MQTAIDQTNHSQVRSPQTGDSTRRAEEATMRAAVVTRYGPPEVVRFQQIERPVPGPREVLIRVVVTTVTGGDWRVRSLDLPRGMNLLGRLMLGLTGPRQPVLGSEIAGVVEEVGAEVTRFAPGDEVFAYPSAMGGHAEYAVMAEDGAVAPLPEGMGFDQAVALSFGGTTALAYLRDKGQLQAGERVLIIGASGGVGTAAVQLAKHFGAHVTGVASTRNVELVRALGADEVIDYTEQSWADSDQTWDVILDTVGLVSYFEHRHLVRPRGRLLLVSADLPAMLSAPWAALTSDIQVHVGPVGGDREDLELLKGLAEAGEFTPHIDRRYDFDEIVEAHAYVATRRKRGNVVVRVAPAAVTAKRASRPLR